MIMMMIMMRMIMMVSVNKLDDNQQLRLSLSKTEMVIPTISHITNINNTFMVITRTEGESSQCIDNGTRPS